MSIDLSKLSPQQLDKFIHIQGIIARQREAWTRVRVLRNYYDGDHPVYLSDRQIEYLEPASKSKNANENGDKPSFTGGEFSFAHNTVKSIIDTLRERLSVSGFTINGATMDSKDDKGTSQETALATLLWSWWEDNRLDAQQIRLHRRALRDGTAYVMVDYDEENKRPRFTLHSTYDGTTGITCHRDPENPDIILYMCKYWYTYNPLEADKTGIQRKTVYLPHEIRKYIMGKDGQWEQFSDPGDASWPLVWRDAQGMPLGIATKEFENPGGSEVAQIIGLQNALNKSWLDLMAAADAAGFPILALEYELNAAFPLDKATDDDDIDGDDEFLMAPGRALTIDGGRAHRIEAADLSQLIATIHLLVETIAGISRTPAYYLRPVGGSDVPSGEALKQLESGLVTRAIERQLIFGQAWADTMLLAYKVQQTFGPAVPELPKLKIQTVWDSAETRHELSDAQLGEILSRLGVPQEEIWTILGFTPAKISKWKQTQRSDQAVQMATIAQAVQKQQATQAQPPANQNGTQQMGRAQAFTNGNGVKTP